MVTQKAKSSTTGATPVRRRSRPKKDPPLGQQLAEIARAIPESAWKGFPIDAAAHFDEYLESGEFDD